MNKNNKFDDKLREKIEHSLNELDSRREIDVDSLIS